jgi:hypothetical protein
VDTIFIGRDRAYNRRFQQMCGHYLVEPVACTPASGWEKGPKELKGQRFPGYVAPRFIHSIAQSENLLPFVFGPHRAPVAIPASRDANGAWHIYEPADIRRMGFTRTARRFTQIDNKLLRNCKQAIGVITWSRSGGTG